MALMARGRRPGHRSGIWLRRPLRRSGDACRVAARERRPLRCRWSCSVGAVLVSLVLVTGCTVSAASRPEAMARVRELRTVLEPLAMACRRGFSIDDLAGLQLRLPEYLAGHEQGPFAVFTDLLVDGLRWGRLEIYAWRLQGARGPVAGDEVVAIAFTVKRGLEESSDPDPVAMAALRDLIPPWYRAR